MGGVVDEFEGMRLLGEAGILELYNAESQS